MTIAEKENQVIEDFAMFEDWMDKYEYIIELGKKLEGYPEDKKTEEHLVKGCQSRVWIDARREGDRVVFAADSDALITKGIISLLIDIYSGAPAAEILASDFSVVEKIGLRENLSPTRANGLVSMIQTIRSLAAE